MATMAPATPYLAEKNKINKIKLEMHTHCIRNNYNIQGMHVIEVKGAAHLLFS